MADRYIIAAGGTWLNAGSDIFDTIGLPNAPAGDGGGIAGGDTAILNSDSGTVAVVGNAVCAGFDATGFAGIFTVVDTKDLDINGTAILPSVNVPSGTATIYCGGSTTFLAGSTLDAKLNFVFDGGAGNWTLTHNDVEIGGDYTVNNTATSFTVENGLQVAGDVLYTAGKHSETSIFLTGTGTLSWNAAATVRPTFTVVSGTRTGNGVVNCTGFYSLVAGIYRCNTVLTIYPAANDFMEVLGIFTGTSYVAINMADSYSNAGQIVLNNVHATGLLVTASSKVLVLYGKIEVLNSQWHGTAGVDTITVYFEDSYSNLGTLCELGFNGTNRHAAFNCSGIMEFGEIRLDVGANAGSTIALGDCVVMLSGVFTGTGITVSADDELVHFVNPTGGAGQLTDVDIAGGAQTHAHDCTVDGTCTGISDDTQVRHDAMLMMGIGG